MKHWKPEGKYERCRARVFCSSILCHHYHLLYGHFPCLRRSFVSISRSVPSLYWLVSTSGQTITERCEKSCWIELEIAINNDSLPARVATRKGAFRKLPINNSSLFARLRFLTPFLEQSQDYLCYCFWNYQYDLFENVLLQREIEQIFCRCSAKHFLNEFSF